MHNEKQNWKEKKEKNIKKNSMTTILFQTFLQGYKLSEKLCLVKHLKYKRGL